MAKQRKTRNNNQQVQRQQPANNNNIHKSIKSVVEFAPRNIAQAKLLRAIENERNHIVMALGPAGSGKTFITAKYAIQQLLSGEIEKIVITRPTVEAGESLGFLPGGLDEKMEPWLLPIYDVFMEEEGVTRADIRNMLAMGIIEIAPFQFLRGRSFRNSIIIADEMQNSEGNQLKMLLTRIGEGSKILITGDLEQSDKTWKNRQNGLQDFITRFTMYNKADTGIEILTFSEKDIVRHEIIAKVLDIYKDLSTYSSHQL
jgi:phosphate starvation-inducible protein PhoH and related proteins